jgi:FtsH-binding integral membrane protein
MSLDAATQLWGFEICLGLACPNAILNDCLFLQVTAAKVSNNQGQVLFPTLTVKLGVILFSLKGIIISNS